MVFWASYVTTNWKLKMVFFPSIVVVVCWYLSLSLSIISHPFFLFWDTRKLCAPKICTVVGRNDGVSTYNTYQRMYTINNWDQKGKNCWMNTQFSFLEIESNESIFHRSINLPTQQTNNTNTTGTVIFFFDRQKTMSTDKLTCQRAENYYFLLLLFILLWFHGRMDCSQSK
jgi:hypothetical protein